MPKIPDSFIADLLQRVDVYAVISQYVSLKKKGNNYFGSCPFHQEKTASFSVAPDKGFYHCFGCGAHGNAIRFLMGYQGLTFVEAVEDLASRSGLALPNTEYAASSSSHLTPLYALMSSVADHYQQALTREVQCYLQERGLTEAVITRFRLGYASGFSLKTLAIEESALLQVGLLTHKEGEQRCFERFRRRLMFPIEDYRGRVVAFGGRLLEAGEPKYLNSPETPLFVKGDHLYGFYHARTQIAHTGEVLVVEGYMDVLSLVQVGIENVVAVLGTACSLKHVQYLGRYAKEIVFCFDGDGAGTQAAERVFQHVLRFIDDTHRCAFVMLPAGEDPDSLAREKGKDGFLEVLRSVKLSFSQFFFQLLLSRAGRDVHSPEGQAAFVHLLKSWVKDMVESALQFSIVQKAAQIIHVEVAHLQQFVLGTARVFSAQPARSFDAVSRYAQNRRESSLPMTIERKLFALLFFCPAAYERVPLAWVADSPGDAQALRFLLEWSGAQASHALSTAYLSEALSETPWREWSCQAWDGVFPYLSDTEWESEFGGALLALEKHYLERRCQHFVSQASLSALLPEEQKQLRALLARLADVKRSLVHVVE